MGLAFLFRLIAAHVAELTRSFDEAALPVRAFLNGCGLVAEGVNRSPGQLRGLASPSSFDGPDGAAVASACSSKPADRFRADGRGSDCRSIQRLARRGMEARE